MSALKALAALVAGGLLAAVILGIPIWLLGCFVSLEWSLPMSTAPGRAVAGLAFFVGFACTAMVMVEEA